MSIAMVIGSLILLLLLLALSFRRGPGDRSEFPSNTKSGGGNCLLDIPPPNALKIVHQEEAPGEINPLLSPPLRRSLPGGEVEEPRT